MFTTIHSLDVEYMSWHTYFVFNSLFDINNFSSGLHIDWYDHAVSIRNIECRLDKDLVISICMSSLHISCVMILLYKCAQDVI